MADGAPTLPARLRRDASALLANVLPSSGVRSLCIVTNGRAGSSLLVDLLDAHPKMRCHGEIFAEWHDFPYLLIRGRLRAARLKGLAAYGFKINVNNLSLGTVREGSPFGKAMRPATFIDRLHRTGSVLVHVRRRNLFVQAVSGLRLTAHERSMADGVKQSERPAMEIDPVQLLAIMRRNETQDRRLAEIVGPLGAIDVWYEDDLETAEAQQPTVDRIFTSLGLETHPVSTSRRKVARPDRRQDVSNLDEVEQVVRATRFATFLDQR